MNRKATDWETITTVYVSGCLCTVSVLAHTGTLPGPLCTCDSTPCTSLALQNPYPSWMAPWNFLALWIDANTFAMAIGSVSLLCAMCTSILCPASQTPQHHGPCISCSPEHTVSGCSCSLRNSLTRLSSGKPPKTAEAQWYETAEAQW